MYPHHKVFDINTNGAYQFKIIQYQNNLSKVSLRSSAITQHLMIINLMVKHMDSCVRYRAKAFCGEMLLITLIHWVKMLLSQNYLQYVILHSTVLNI